MDKVAQRKGMQQDKEMGKRKEPMHLPMCASSGPKRAHAPESLQDALGTMIPNGQGREKAEAEILCPLPGVVRKEKAKAKISKETVLRAAMLPQAKTPRRAKARGKSAEGGHPQASTIASLAIPTSKATAPKVRIANSGIPPNADSSKRGIVLRETNACSCINRLKAKQEETPMRQQQQQRMEEKPHLVHQDPKQKHKVPSR